MGQLTRFVRPLVEALHLPMNHVAKNGKHFLTSAGVMSELSAMPISGSKLLLPMTVKASYLSESLSASGGWVLVRVVGDLYLFAMVGDMGVTTVFVLDADKQPITPQTVAMLNGMAPLTALKLLYPNIVGRYSAAANKTWERERVDAYLVGFGTIFGSANGATGGITI